MNMIVTAAINKPVMNVFQLLGLSKPRTVTTVPVERTLRLHLVVFLRLQTYTCILSQPHTTDTNILFYKSTYFLKTSENESIDEGNFMLLPGVESQYCILLIEAA